MPKLLLPGLLMLIAGCAQPGFGGKEGAGAAPVPAPKRPATSVRPSQTDSDHDGVPNEVDRCPATANGTAVDTLGCALIEKVSLEGVSFDSGSAELKTGGFDLLRSVAVAMLVYPDLKVEVRGYSDSIGDAEANRKLSGQRAEAVKAFLVREGVPSQRLSAIGLGSAEPIDTNDTAEGRMRNRRVAFKVKR